ncbi:MAG: murein L,D-transpeptidase catalytic domain family protein [Syntrophales bacterium]
MLKKEVKITILLLAVLSYSISLVYANDIINFNEIRLFESNHECIDSFYKQLQPAESKPSYKAFYKGILGYYSMLKEGKIQNKKYLTLIDFSLSSKVRRLWVIDLEIMRIIHNSLVAHGKSSGEEFAVKFSNTPESKMSSLGFYLTGSEYYGKYGLSLYLDGIEPGINDNARKRAIVMHSAPYATGDFTFKFGRLGRSFGCPAVPPEKSTAIIEVIKDKSCLFIYYPSKSYFVKSKYLNSV